MHTRKLGPFTVSALGLGCMGMSQSYGTPDEEEAKRTLLRALDLGYTLFDTAALYGFGHNEKLLGEVLQPYRDRITLASKCGLFGRDGKRTLDSSPAMIREICEQSLRNLRTEVIDLYYLHRVDPKVPVEESIGALAELVQEGKIKTIGISEASSENVRRAHAVHPLIAVQSEYSLWTRKPEVRVLPLCKELGINFVAFSPLGRAFLTGKLTDPGTLEEKDLRRTMPRFQDENFQANLKLLEEFKQIAEDNPCTPAQLALAWLLAKDEIILPIPGTKRVKYLEENAAAADIKLSETDFRRIDELINEQTIAGKRYKDEVLKSMDSEND